MLVRDRPLLTEVFEEPSAFAPAPDSAYVLHRSPEARSEHFTSRGSMLSNVRLVEIGDIQPLVVSITVEQNTWSLQLRSARALAGLWHEVSGMTVYLDITGMPHHVWAPLLRSALQARAEVVVVYLEPDKYRPSGVPTEGEIYDLSERIAGVAPIPGFTSFVEATDDVCFIPLLGFEGTRLAYLIEQTQPPNDKITPVIGVPGFQPEYPFVTFVSNRFTLLETQAWRRVRFATASCPFSLFYALEDIASDFPDHLLKVAPIGTKPHALGAALFALANPSTVELVYDHPVHRLGRTEGTGRLHLYHVSSFIA